jgi:hypothetical protein
MNNKISLVCVIYNFAKHTWTDDVVKEFAKAVLSKTAEISVSHE